MIKKIITSGLLAGVIMLFISLLLSRIMGIIFPSILAEYNNSQLFRPWSDPLMSLMFAEPFVVGIILALIFHKTKTLFKSPFVFGFGYWLTTIPGMIMSYSSFQVSLLLTIIWSLTIFLQALAASYIYKKMLT